jgi:ketosteroid isomerase-like protein
MLCSTRRGQVLPEATLRRGLLAGDTARTVPQENVEIVRRLWANLEREPMNLPLDLLDEEIEVRNPPGFPVAEEYDGHDGARRWAAEVWEVFSEFHHDVEEVIEVGDGETVVSVQRLKGRMRHSGLEMNLRWAAVWRLRNGKAVSAHGYMTRREAFEAAGLEVQR